MQPDDEALAGARDEAEEVAAAWGLSAGTWRLVGVLPGMRGAIVRPVLDTPAGRYVVRRQPDALTEDDARFRHAFTRHLIARGVPVPDLLPRTDGSTLAILPDGLYALPAYVAGSPFDSSGPETDRQLRAAATTLGAFHQASADFPGEPHLWAEERTGAGLARAYKDLIGRAAESSPLGPAIANGLRRVAEGSAEAVETAAEALFREPLPPALHIHGDYQAHNLAFDGGTVAAIYDLDAAHWDARLFELAYSLIYFAGVRWDDAGAVTPPLAGDGLDILRAHAYLGAYGREAPPADGEARQLADALALAFPIVFANGVAEDLLFPDDYAEPPDEEDALTRLQWADTFALWAERYRDVLAQAWEAGATG